MQCWSAKFSRVSSLQVFITCIAVLLNLSVTDSATAQTVNNNNDETRSRIIIKWKETSTRTRAQSMDAVSKQLHTTFGVTLNHRHRVSEHLDAMQLDTPQRAGDFAKTLAQLNAHPDVEFAVEDKRRFAHALPLPNDPYFLASGGRTGQWYLNTVEIAAINALNAWNISTGGTAGSGVIVAVVDTGIRPDHPDLIDKILPGRDFVSCDQANTTTCSGAGLTLIANDNDGWDADPQDPGDWITQAMINANPSVFPSSSCTAEPTSSWHGTRVSGIIAATPNNSIGIVGTGYNARILPVRALGRCGGFDSDIIAGMRWAAGLSVPGVPINPNPAKVINLSLGGADTCDSAYSSAVNEIHALGVSIVASAGNDSAITNTPANCPGVIGVAGIRNMGTKVGFSSLGPEVTIAAPAGNCVNTSGPCLFSIDTTTNLGTTTPGANDYTDQTNTNLGTSFSAPIVSGAIALMLGASSNLTPDLIKSRLQATATAFPTSTTVPACVSPNGSHTPLTTNEGECYCTTALCGAGMVNALKAVQSVAAPTIMITGATSVAVGDNIVLNASASTAADGGTLTFTWSKVTDSSGAAMLSSTAMSSITVTAPNSNETLVVGLSVSDSWGNSATQNYSITVGTGSSSSSSSSASSVSSTSSSSASASGSASSSAASSNSASVSSAKANEGGGTFDWTLLTCLAALFWMRTKRTLSVSQYVLKAN